MRLSTKSEYALLALADLVHHGPGLVKIQDIAKRQGVSRKYLERILLTLRKGGYLRSQRGKRGGRLAVQVDDGLFGVGNYPEDLAREVERQAGERDGDEGLVGAGLPIAGGRIEGRIVLPDPTDGRPTHRRILGASGVLVKDGC